MKKSLIYLVLTFVTTSTIAQNESTEMVSKFSQKIRPEIIAQNAQNLIKVGSIDMSPRDKIKEIQRKSKNSEWSPAELIEEYKKVVALCKDKDDEYELLYAWYMIMVTATREKNMVQQSVEAARQCMALLQPNISAGSIMHFTDIGQFQEEVIRYATNAIVWNEFQKTNSKEGLDKLLALINLGSSYADEPKNFYVLDTKVRLLLKMGRKEEAYKIVRTCLIKDKDFSDFQDFKHDKDYQLWNESQKSTTVNVAELSEKTKELLRKYKRIHDRLQNRIAKERASKDEFVEVIPQKSFMTMKDIKNKFKLQFYGQDDELVLVFTGNLYIKGPLNEKWLNKQLESVTEGQRKEVSGMIVIGDLVVDGDILDNGELQLWVTQNLKCDYMLSSDGIIEVLGNVDIKYGVHGYYNDGVFRVGGKISAPYVFNYDHDMPGKAQYEGEHARYSAYEGKERYECSFQNTVKPTVWNEDDTFSLKKFFELVRNGENPFLEVK